MVQLIDPDREERLFEHLTKFVRCQECAKVSPAESFLWLLIDTPAPCCGARGTRSIWPDDAVALYLDVATQQVHGEQGLRVQALILAAAGELVLNRIVYQILVTRTSDGLVAIKFIDRCRGFAALKRAYKDLTRKSVKEALATAGFGDASDAWEAIVEFRNHVAHGDWHSGR